MMNADMHTLSTLLGQAESARDEAQAALRAASQAATRAEAQWRQLVDYRGEYEQRWAAQFSRQAAIEIVLCYRNFMERLEQAVAQQRRVCEHAEAQVVHSRERLAAHEMQVASVRKLIERRLQDLQARQRRLDQKRDDEAGQRAMLRRPAAPADSSFY